MQTKRFIYVCTIAASMLLPAAAARGEFYEVLGRGLFLAGFPVNADHNPITKGFDATASRSFFNDTLNFGVGTLTLTGGMTFDASLARRPIPGVSFGMKTTANPDGAPQPLTYTLSIPRALETITVTGNITIQTSTKVDETGFYSRVVNVENRGTVTTTGLVASENPIDFNIGPVNQVGNIYLDILGGVVNVLGGNGDAIADLPNSPPLISLSQADLDSLDLDDPEQLEAYVNAVLLEGINQAVLDPNMGETTVVPSTVPEPSTLALLVISSSLTYFGTRRRRATV